KLLSVSHSCRRHYQGIKGQASPSRARLFRDSSKGDSPCGSFESGFHSLCDLGCLGTHYIDQARLVLRTSFCSVFPVLGLLVCTHPYDVSEWHLSLLVSGNLKNLSWGKGLLSIPAHWIGPSVILQNTLQTCKLEFF
ncbi:RIKEN cDNA 2500002L14, isoform CRA_d, partial [Mus musculus]